MKTKLVNTEDYILLIDEESETAEGYGLNLKSLEVDKTRSCYKALYKITNTKKVIAYYPLAKEAKELDLALLPNPFRKTIKKSDRNRMVLENFVLDYTHQNIDEAKGNAKNMYNHIDTYIDEDHVDGVAGDSEITFGQFSLEDMINAFENGLNSYKDSLNDCHSNSEPRREDLKKQFIESISIQQLPKEFVPDYTWEWFNDINDAGWENISPSDMDAIIAHGLVPRPQFRKKLKTITNSEGKQELAGTYQF